MSILQGIINREILRKHPSLLVLIAITSLQQCLLVGIGTWGIFTKDYRITKSKPHKYLNDDMDMLHPYRLKMYIKHPEINLAPRPKLHEVYSLMKAEEKRRRDSEKTGRK